MRRAASESRRQLGDFTQAHRIGLGSRRHAMAKEPNCLFHAAPLRERQKLMRASSLHPREARFFAFLPFPILLQVISVRWFLCLLALPPVLLAFSRSFFAFLACVSLPQRWASLALDPLHVGTGGVAM